MSLVDVSELFSDPEFMQAATRRRGTRAFAVSGEGEITTSYADTAITVSFQPVQGDGENLDELLPEGQRGSGALFRLFSSSELRVDDGNTGLADVVTVGARRFKVMHVDDWSDHGYFRAIAEEIAL